MKNAIIVLEDFPDPTRPEPFSMHAMLRPSTARVTVNAEDLLSPCWRLRRPVVPLAKDSCRS